MGEKTKKNRKSILISNINIHLSGRPDLPLWVFARYLCKELMVFLIPVILLFLTLGPFATYVTNYFLWPGWGDKLIIKGE